MSEFLYLSENDIINAGALNLERCTEVIEELFGLLSSGDYVMGGESRNSHGIEMTFPEESPHPNMPKDAPDRRFMAMPAYVGARFHTVGVKWYGSNIENPKRGLPRSVLTLMLTDPDTCEPIALMSANLISSTRTGCVPAVATRHLARSGAERLGCIGAGPVGRACAEAILTEAKHIKSLAVYDLSREKAEAFCEDMAGKFGVVANAAESLEAAVRGADIVSIAASAVKPVCLSEEWLGAGSLLILSGRCSVEDSYFDGARVIFDNAKMHAVYYAEQLARPTEKRFTEGMGVDIYRLIYEKKLPPLDKSTSLGDVIAKKAAGRVRETDRICFLAGGMPVWDVGWGYEIYKNAKTLGLGTPLSLWDTPYLS